MAKSLSIIRIFMEFSKSKKSLKFHKLPKKIVTIALIIFGSLGLLYFTNFEKGSKDQKINFSLVKSKNIKLCIIYDNNVYLENLTPDWGFSCYIDGLEKRILFDTGSYSSILINNMNKLKINISDVDIVVLSHIHSDHTGGLKFLLELNPNLTVYILKSFPDSFKRFVSSHAKKTIEVENLTEIYKGVFSTGEMGTFIKEQALIINTDAGLVVITGCAHPGIVKIIERARNTFKKDVLLVVGGFHLFGKSKGELNEIVKTFKKMNVKFVAPCHCTGDSAIDLFSKIYSKNFIKTGVGKIIELQDLLAVQ